MTNIVDLATKRAPVLYTVHITHHWDGSIDVAIEGLGNPPSEQSKQSVIYGLTTAVDLIESTLEVTE